MIETLRPKIPSWLSHIVEWASTQMAEQTKNNRFIALMTFGGLIALCILRVEGSAFAATSLVLGGLLFSLVGKCMKVD